MNDKCPKCGAEAASFIARVLSSQAYPLHCNFCQAPLAPLAWPPKLLANFGIAVLLFATGVGLVAYTWWPLLLAWVIFSFATPVVNGLVPLSEVPDRDAPIHPVARWILAWHLLFLGTIVLLILAYGFQI